jgi:hypothetical protein
MILPIGTPLWKKPVEITNGVATNTLCVLPADSTDAHTEFAGVTVRDGEDSESALQLQRTGDILARVMGPFKFGDIARFSPGVENLAVGNGKAAVGKILQAFSGASVVLAKVRTASATESTSSSGGTFPFQVSKVSDTQVSVERLSFCLKGLNAKDTVKIWGLGKPFDVTKTAIIYLEILFDINLAPFFASICCADSWGAEFPRMVKTVKKAENDAEKTALTAAFDNHVGVDSFTLSTQLDAALEKLDVFKIQTATVKQFAARVPIAFATEADVDGLSLVDGATHYVMRQVLKTDLMLAPFCDSNVPVSYPIPSLSPIVDTLPSVVLVLAGGAVSMSVPDHPDAEIFYTLDGSSPSVSSPIYSTPIAEPTDGQTLKAIAAESGYLNSKVATL